MVREAIFIFKKILLEAVPTKPVTMSVCPSVGPYVCMSVCLFVHQVCATPSRALQTLTFFAIISFFFLLLFSSFFSAEKLPVAILMNKTVKIGKEIYTKKPKPSAGNRRRLRRGLFLLVLRKKYNFVSLTKLR